MSEIIALVGSETLMGRELRDLLSTNSLGVDLQLIASAEESSGILSEQAGEPAFVAKLDTTSLIDADVVLLAGTEASAREAVELAPEKPFVDLTHALEDNPRARVRAPMVEPGDMEFPADAIHLIAHPAAIALALLLSPLERDYDVAAVIVHVFEPASERGAPGVDELQNQTLSLLSFKPMPKRIFDAQLSFSMLARLGEEAVTSVAHVEARMERDLATLLENASVGPMPSLRLIQAPVFHGHSFSVWIEFDEAPEVQEIERLLAAENVDVRDSDLEPPNNVGAAGQEGIAVGAITADPNNPRAIWIWMAADNLRLAARNALMVAREVA